MSIIGTILIVLVVLVILILVPLLLDLLFGLTVRSNRSKQILHLAKARSKQTNKPIIVFNDANTGVVLELDGSVSPEFKTDIVEAITQMEDNSSVLIISQALEYIDPIQLPAVIEQMRKVSGGDLYVLGIERSSPRTIWDYKLRTLLSKPFYLPSEPISWARPNTLQVSLQHFYEYVFKIMPYSFFAYNPIVDSATIDGSV
ncbi:Hypothetical protein MVR_LOCUS206 [uncultured virus]|nr:Hypothetical protein MVR_LOCUS206 [uncultured virus]